MMAQEPKKLVDYLDTYLPTLSESKSRSKSRGHAICIVVINCRLKRCYNFYRKCQKLCLILNYFDDYLYYKL